MKLALFAAAATIAPFILLRARLIVRYFALSVPLWLVAAFWWRVARVFAIEADPYLAVVACGVLNALILWLLIATADDADVNWSASRAAIAVGLFYLAAVPLMMRTPPDGDESFYILITESIVHDGDLDLGNQFRDLARSVTARTDLVPQLGDRVQPDGSVYSHLEPFLAFLLLPGYLAGGLAGVLATMAVFGALLARSTIRLLEDEQIPGATIRAVFPFVAFGQPVVFYAIRVWPEVPAAFFFVEAIRGIRARRLQRWVPALLGLVLLKVRFALVAVVLVARAVRRPKQLAIAALIVAIPVILGFAFTAHRVSELVPGDMRGALRGLFGLLLDGQQGIAFQAPFYLLGIVAITRWKSMPESFRIGMTASALYVFYLVPRAEWHGGWSPPLRYIVFLMPILALGAASLWQRIDHGAIATIAAWTAALTVHGMAFPWRLFHIANGESVAGEALSTIWHSDFSRVFPSFIRMNTAAIVAAIVFVIGVAVFKTGRLATPGIVAGILLVAFLHGRQPGDRVEFEDAHVVHQGGDLYPYVWQVARFLYRGGWVMHPGDSLSFLARGGKSVLWYQSPGATVQVGSRAYALPPTGAAYGAVVVRLDRDGRTELRCLSGAVNLDRMDHE
jgi:hypothetical protein